MKSNIKYIAASLLLCATAMSCREEHLLGSGEGVGRMNLSASVMDEIKVVSRSLTTQQHNELCSSALIWISRVNADNSRDHLFKYEGLASFPDDGLPLESGSYLAEVWTGDSIPASWDGIRYHGTTPFEIVSGDEIDVDVVCTVRNTLVDIRLSDAVRDVLSDIVMTVSLDEEEMPDGLHSLTFEGHKLNDTGYFMINTKTRGFKWTLTGTDLNGQPFTHSDVYTDQDAVVDEFMHVNPGLCRATRYIFNINYNAEQGGVEIGGAYLDINVEPEPVEGTSVSEIIALAPQFQGADGLDIDAPILREPGNAGRISFQIIGSSQLTGVRLESDMLQPLIGTNACDLMAMDASSVQLLSDKGIMFVPVDKRSDEDKADGEFVPTNMHISLEETFMNVLEEGEYSLLVTATDMTGKSGSQLIDFSITQVPGIVSATDVPETSYTSATLMATIMKPGDRMGFEVKSAGPARAYEDWTFVPGVLDGDKLTAVISDLQAGYLYDYRLVVDDYISQVYTAQTQPYPQLPNAGFEEWKPLSSNSKVTLLCADESKMFWDSGNHGSATMSKLVTDKDDAIKHSGNYSAKLKSQFVGIGTIGRFAAGNAFVGKYLNTDGTDGELGWGRPWDSQAKPKALKIWAKYTPGTVEKKVFSNTKAPDDLKDEFPTGAQDKGIIYIALIDNTNPLKETYDGVEWPVVVKTKTAQLFDKTASYVKAYGEHVFETATDGEGLIEITIPINDVHPGEFTHLMLVASASKGGDYFLGGEGSTLWLDDFELIY